MTPKFPRSVAIAAAGATVLLTPFARGADASAPIQIDAPEQRQLDLTKTDGGLLPVRGAQNFGVFRASKTKPALAEGKGYAYNHHPDLAVWHGKFYVAWDSGQKDEDTWPARELYSTSPDGREWSGPQELFPEGVSVPMRLYFYLAPNGRMLAFAGLRLDHAKTDEDTKGPLVVREIKPDHTLGPVHTLRPPTAGARPGDPAAFTTSPDAGYVTACRQLLAARVTLETQDYGVLLDPDQRIAWHDASKWPNGKLGNGFWKATSFYHRRDGAIVGIGKAGWTSVSTDEGKTWSLPVVPPTLTTNNAKVWGQRTGDGRFALVYNPTPRPRYPLVVVTGDDGISFGNMRVVQTQFPPQRYAGINKNTGLQYIRGLAEWADDGSIPDSKAALWLTYSANKEDIWVSRLALPLDHPGERESRWNRYEPRWTQISEQPDGEVRLSSREPFDRAEVSQRFPPAANVVIKTTVVTPSAGPGALDLELLAGIGGARPVRLRFCGDGFLRAIDRDKMVEFGHFAPGTRLALTLEAHCGPRGIYSVAIDDKKVGEAQFAETVSTVERIACRLWARTDADRAPVFLPATADVGAEFDQPADDVSGAVGALSIR